MHCYILLPSFASTVLNTNAEDAKFIMNTVILIILKFR